MAKTLVLPLQWTQVRPLIRKLDLTGATIADPHFSFPSKQLFMVLSVRGLGKKVGEMVSLDWHYKQGKTVL